MYDAAVGRPAGQVRVAAYNVRAFRDDRAALVRVVRSIAPDVLLVQEAPRHPGSGHRVAAFAEQVGMTWSAGRRGRMSTTLLTSLRLDVLSCEHHNLPVDRWEEPRGYAIAGLRLPGHRAFSAVSVHLSLRDDQRGPHCARILEAIGQQGAAVVLGGDLNETFGAGAWLALRRVLNPVTADGLTSPSGTPAKTIDGLLATSSLPGWVPDLGLDVDDLRRATDHRPVYADFDLSVDGG